MDAKYLAPFLDQGAIHKAWITKILGNGRVPIPVVQTHLYDRESLQDLGQSDSKYQQTNSGTISKGKGSPWPWVVLAVIGVVLVFVAIRTQG